MIRSLPETAGLIRKDNPMKISTEIGSIAERVGERKAIEMCAKAGFDGWDFSMFEMARYDWRTDSLIPSDHPLSGKDYLKFARELRKIGEDNGIRCNQSHAPFPVCGKVLRDRLPWAIECTAEVGGEICVIHPDNNKTAEENAQMYLELLPFAKACNVKLATENMWNWHEGDEYSSFAACATSESFCQHVDAVGDDFLVACLDIGHAEMKGSGSGAVNMIYALGNRLQALHLHDNDRHYDSHQIPFSMDVDWKAVVKALKDIGYKGWFTLECGNCLNKYDADSVFTGVQEMAAAARKLARMFEEGC